MRGGIIIIIERSNAAYLYHERTPWCPRLLFLLSAAATIRNISVHDDDCPQYYHVESGDTHCAVRSRGKWKNINNNNKKNTRSDCNENRIIRVSGQVWSVSRYSWSQIVFALTSHAFTAIALCTVPVYIYTHKSGHKPWQVYIYTSGRSNFWGFRFSSVRHHISRNVTNNYYYWFYFNSICLRVAGLTSKGPVRMSDRRVLFLKVTLRCWLI